MKIAVPVKDESLEIVTRTGRAPYFAIFECDENGCKLLSLNENTHAQEHEHEHQEEYTADEVAHHHRHVKASKLSGVDYIVVRAIGPNMEDALKMEGIKIIKVSKKDGEKALEVLEKIKEKLV
ncbi:MAG: NifB/NifX family molybdenum-iron cluster-binding protein [Nautiliaceae bacterium]